MSATIRLPKSLNAPKVVWVISHRRKGEKWVFWGWRNTAAEARMEIEQLLKAGWYGARLRRTVVKPSETADEYKRRQAVRRKTLFPLSPKLVRNQRAIIAAELHGMKFSFYEIRQVLKCSGPEDARRLVARAHSGRAGIGRRGQLKVSADDAD